MQKDKAYIAYLAGLARLKDHVALEKLVVHFGPRLFVHAYRLLGHREEARDAVQDAWVEIVRSPGWVSWVIMLVQGALFVAGVWPAWRFLQLRICW